MKHRGWWGKSEDLANLLIRDFDTLKNAETEEQAVLVPAIQEFAQKMHLAPWWVVRNLVDKKVL